MFLEYNFNSNQEAICKDKELSMFKKLTFVFLSLGIMSHAQAFDKTQVNLDQSFWGTWVIYNSQQKCSETYQFKKPGQFQYSSLQKKMSGNFSVMRDTKNVNNLDILNMKVATDNKKASCGSVETDLANKNLSFSLKWVSPKTAQICMDTIGKQCSSLYLIKQ